MTTASSSSTSSGSTSSLLVGDEKSISDLLTPRNMIGMSSALISCTCVHAWFIGWVCLAGNSLFSDVQFRVGHEKRIVPAHRVILAMSLPGLARMFMTTTSNNNGIPIIDLPDVTPATFEAVLEFAYIGNC
jgi:hypothetical protein